MSFQPGGCKCCKGKHDIKRRCTSFVCVASRNKQSRTYNLEYAYERQIYSVDDGASSETAALTLHRAPITCLYFSPQLSCHAVPVPALLLHKYFSGYFTPGPLNAAPFRTTKRFPWFSPKRATKHPPPHTSLAP